MKTLGDVLTLTADFLKDKQLPRARRTAEEMVAHSLKIKRLDLYMQFDRPVLESELEILRPMLKRAAKGEPVEYITGEVSFYHCAIKVTPHVLIPRPETEILVDQACRLLKAEQKPGLHAWDVCTGSGCIGIAVKKACPDLTMALSDRSAEALQVAQENAEKNGVEVELRCGDLLEPFCGSKADVVFCNPPYVSDKEFIELGRSVKDFEPKEALCGGADGGDFYRRLSAELPALLNPGAKVFLEIGNQQGELLKALFSGKEWKTARLEKDWSGHDRFFFLEFE